MIVKMKFVTLLMLEKAKENALETLRNAGVMHLSSSFSKPSQDTSALEKKIADADRIVNMFLSCKAKGGKSSSGMNGEEELLQKALRMDTEKERLSKEADVLSAEIEQLFPWGSFDPEMLKKVSSSGTTVTLCSLQESEMENFTVPAGAVIHKVAVLKKTVYFAVIGYHLTEEELAALPEVPLLPQKPLNDLQKALDICKEKTGKLSEEFAQLSLSSGILLQYRAKMASDLEFLQARDAMQDAGKIVYLTGYVPVTGIDLLAAEAKKNAWGIRIEDVDDDDLNVPTFIVKPKWMNVIDPLFDFIGIAPGYREKDVNLFFLLAFPVFFGLIVGDTGYGLLFMFTAFLCKYLFRGKPKAQLSFNLLILLSCFSILWGMLTGNCLGIPREKLPFFLRGLDFFAEPTRSAFACTIANKYGLEHIDNDLSNRFTQFLCFVLAALHLISARIWRTFLELPDWRAAGNVGWALLIFGNFLTAVNLIVFPGFFPVPAGYIIYGVGVVLIVATIRGQAAFNLPFDMISSFVDVLSYIRLFAVGLSGLYVAQSFNLMAKQVLDALPGKLVTVGIIGLIFVAVFGHVLNIMLSFLSVLVHAIRLNTLEFSNHAGLQWTGIRYQPFSKKDEP